ncbi:MAG: hypothetical protein EBU84_16485 [Actinobacteria bacterium]|nr:hypothetical protein [Actinomycetota bacterium]
MASGSDPARVLNGVDGLVSGVPGVFKASTLTERLIRLPEEVAEVFPELGVARGRTISCFGGSAVSLGLRLLASACHTGGWCAIVSSTRSINPAAAREAGVALERTLWITAEDLGSATALCLESCAAVLVHGEVVLRDARRLQARANTCSSTLILLNSDYTQADIVFETTNERWEGLLSGYGHLIHRDLELHVRVRHAAPMSPKRLRLHHVSIHS